MSSILYLIYNKKQYKYLLLLFIFILLGLIISGISQSLPKGKIYIAMSSPIYNYLQPTYKEFINNYEDISIEFILLDNGKTLSIEQELDAFFFSLETNDKEDIKKYESFKTTFIAVVSPFNPTQELSLETLKKIFTNQINNWSTINQYQNKDIEIVTYQNNPADTLLVPHLSTSPVKYSKVFNNYNELINYLSLTADALAIIPLHKKKSAINILNLKEQEDYLFSSIYIQESSHPFLPDKIFKWFKNKDSRTSILYKFINFMKNNQHKNNISQKELSLSFVGDIMLARRVDNLINKYGVNYPFKKVHNILQQADLVFANLETPISDKGHLINMFRADPKIVEGLLYAGIDLVSIANNHIQDYDYPAFFDTIEYLNNSGIKTIGAGKNLSQARKPAIFSIKGQSIAFLAYTELWFCYTKDNRQYAATPHQAGVAPLKKEYIIEDIKNTSKKADFIIVSFHWGEEYSHLATETQREFAHLAIETGANIVIGHHPHVLQGLEFYQEGVIFYSLGNFIFDQTRPGTQETLIANLTICDHKIININLIPGYILNSQVQIIKGKEKNAALNSLLLYSKYIIE